MDAKYCAATQVVDEARHVEAYARLLHEKFELAYPINPHLRALIENVLAFGRLALRGYYPKPTERERDER